MNFIFSQFSEFTWLSYLTFIVIILCWLVLIGTEKTDLESSPVRVIIIANISFWLFLSTTSSETHIYVQIITFLSFLCLAWFWIIRIDEKDQNKVNTTVQSGKDEISNAYHGFKSSIKNEVNKEIGGGFLGELFGTAIDYGTRGADNKLSGFLNFFECGPYVHPSRAKIYKLAIYLVFSMICVVFWL